VMIWTSSPGRRTVACHIWATARSGFIASAWPARWPAAVARKCWTFRTIPRGALTFATARTHLTLHAAAAVSIRGRLRHCGRRSRVLESQWFPLALAQSPWRFAHRPDVLGGQPTYCTASVVTRQADRDEDSPARVIPGSHLRQAGGPRTEYCPRDGRVIAAVINKNAQRWPAPSGECVPCPSTHHLY